MGAWTMAFALVPIVLSLNHELCKKKPSAYRGEEIVCHSITTVDFTLNRTHWLTCDNCTLPTLDERTFLISKNNISYLYLVSSNIHTINDNAFTKFKLLKVLSLRNNSISELTSKAFANLTRLIQLDLSYNKLRILTNNLFAQLANLNQLNLNHNTIYYLQPDAFKGLSTLKHLNLNDNLIEKLDRDGFKHLSELILLHLDNNNIAEVDAFAFTNLHNLKSLYLNNNSITFLTQYNFKPLTNLADLQLRQNELSEIQTSAFNGLTNLQNLYLGHNRLESVKPYGLVGLNNLKVLEMINNRFETFDLSWVQHMKTLTWIWLKQNRITNLTIGVKMDLLESLHSIALSHNNLTTISYKLLYNKCPNVRDIFVDDNVWRCEFLVNMFNFFQEKRVNLCVSDDCNVNATMRYVGDTCALQRQAEDEEDQRVEDISSDFVNEAVGLSEIRAWLLLIAANVIFP